MSADESAVRCIVSGSEMLAWYLIQRLTSSRRPPSLARVDVTTRRRTMPCAPLQSISTVAPSAGSSSSTAPITQGTWYSRLTMPMCESGVPERHTTAVSSSKIGARKVAPASATHATTPSAEVSMSASTSSGDESRRHVPCTGAASNTRTPTAIFTELSVTEAKSNSIRSRAVLPDDGYTLLHEVRLRGLVTVDDNPTVELLISEGLVARARASIRLTSDGRAAHAVWARVPARKRARIDRCPRLRTIPAAECRVPPGLPRLAGATG